MTPSRNSCGMVSGGGPSAGYSRSSHGASSTGHGVLPSRHGRSLARTASDPAMERSTRTSPQQKKRCSDVPTVEECMSAKPEGRSQPCIEAPSQNATEEEPQCTYNAERVIGTGTFGIVYSAHIVETDETVAIKKVFVDKRYRNRELQLWREMRHPNIVTLKHAFYTSGDSPDELYLNMVMEYVPETVYCVMKRFTKQRQTVPRIFIQLHCYQTCRALAHLHASQVVHRDIK